MIAPSDSAGLDSGNGKPLRTVNPLMSIWSLIAIGTPSRSESGFPVLHLSALSSALNKLFYVIFYSK